MRKKTLKPIKENLLESIRNRRKHKTLPSRRRIETNFFFILRKKANHKKDIILKTSNISYSPIPKTGVFYKLKK